MVLKQIKTGLDNFSYIIYCNNHKKAGIVDPSTNVVESLDFIHSNNLDLIYIINTHYHWDHTYRNKKVKKETSAEIVISKIDGKKLNDSIDIAITDEEHLKIGSVDLKFLLTPGHTAGSLCIIVDEEALITGDTLFIGDCGRTDLIGGSPTQMFETLQKKIKTLPDHLIVYPGHDYGEKPFDTLGNQKKTNKTLLAKTFTDFSRIP